MRKEKEKKSRSDRWRRR